MKTKYLGTSLLCDYLQLLKEGKLLYEQMITGGDNIGYDRIIFPPYDEAINMDLNQYRNYVADRIGRSGIYAGEFESRIIEEYINKCPFMIKGGYCFNPQPNGRSHDGNRKFTFSERPNNKTLYIIIQRDSAHYNYIDTAFEK